MVARFYRAVPVINHTLIHLVNAAKLRTNARTILPSKVEDVSMIKMGICYEPDIAHGIPLMEVAGALRSNRTGYQYRSAIIAAIQPAILAPQQGSDHNPLQHQEYLPLRQH